MFHWYFLHLSFAIFKTQFISYGRMKILYFLGWCDGRWTSSHLAGCREMLWGRMLAGPYGLVTKSGYVGTKYHSYHRSLWSFSVWNFAMYSFHWAYVLLSMEKKISGRRYILILCDTEWFHSKNAEITVGSFLKSSSASMDDHGLLTWVPHNTVKTVFRCTPELPFLMLW